MCAYYIISPYLDFDTSISPVNLIRLSNYGVIGFSGIVRGLLCGWPLQSYS